MRKIKRAKGNKGKLMRLLNVEKRGEKQMEKIKRENDEHRKRYD